MGGKGWRGKRGRARASSRVPTGWVPTHHGEGREQRRRGGRGVERRGRRVQGGGRGAGLEEDRARREGRVQQVHGLGVGRRVGRGLAHEADVGDAAGGRLGPRPRLALTRGRGLGGGRRGGGRGVGRGHGGGRGVRGCLLAGPPVFLQELRAARELRELGSRGGLGGLRASTPFGVHSWEDMAGFRSLKRPWARWDPAPQAPMAPPRRKPRATRAGASPSLSPKGRRTRARARGGSASGGRPETQPGGGPAGELSQSEPWLGEGVGGWGWAARELPARLPSGFRARRSRGAFTSMAAPSGQKAAGNMGLNTTEQTDLQTRSDHSIQNHRTRRLLGAQGSLNI